MEAIAKFTDAFRFLSNFYPSPIKLGGIVYPTAEHAYQAMKTKDRKLRQEIARLKTPGEAKRFGRSITLRSDWEKVKRRQMHRIITAKFTSIRSLRTLLLATGDAKLVEGNHWGDTYWGVCMGLGENHLGKILMKVRSELRNPKKTERLHPLH